MARGWHYTKLSLSSALLLSFFLVGVFYYCSFLFVVSVSFRYVFFWSRWSFVDVPLIFFCPVDHVPDWQPCTLLGMVEARSVNVKKNKKTKQHQQKQGVKIKNNVSQIYNIFGLGVPECRSEVIATDKN